MEEKVKKIIKEAEEKIALIKEVIEINELKSRFLGKKSELFSLTALFRTLDSEKKKELGILINKTKAKIEALIEVKREEILARIMAEKLAKESLDVTLPGVMFNSGSKHLLTKVIEDFEDFFIGLGYEIKDGPEVESDYYNFEMLNLDKDHPARNMQDTFYVDVNQLLRTHTSPVQVRTMEKAEGKPIQIICPGKVYRRDEDDQYHSHQFMQIEGLVIGEGINMTHLKGTLLAITKHFFGEDKEIRLRPSYFPFTEPSVEVDVFDGEGYVELLGAGMVHPKVLQMSGYNPEVVTGFAFGIGLERLVMIKYGLDDIRHLYTNDLRFLNQFKGVK
ncbi:MAG: phenylalanine--tRNA ligase subunit alpha [Acholeplasmatales bacterium]|jgi:phenylalanyl-tRNA synthetase alpha chain|nr:phenylalanine--tRNA ligase subunit alpha [Acholeplasmataceae bacterium]MCK9289291.1 phenylalanine--tRNA ligase subunit alpha [Acholeplasmataceae bacterium]MCK9427195.1 phenylalanine--tRNA ligase subunit alpha [Acholeplasmataceae bacterium]MDY0115122.1 phenylalanine--tRNA ligase subunit alpha [Acholeplasmatales bacterium]HHT39881.1 phenylalanine--tRNA ligase subunit alpha [Acholeplasmataceae bacterium]